MRRFAWWPGTAKPRPDLSGASTFAHIFFEGGEFVFGNICCGDVAFGIVAIGEATADDEPTCTHEACIVPFHSAIKFVCEVCCPSFTGLELAVFRGGAVGKCLFPFCAFVRLVLIIRFVVA